ncbi:hypothetical protein PGIGA_G00220210 [Pangasianodon gigas]|uniref:Uncharacterized protein n=1 Tax=Pangasianodon gigas TaxID=30993 RepID=A0ACC5WIF8_PANGG|nr:hypothetical protein [Pangasianodon gigas]
MELEAREIPHKFMFVDVAGCNLPKSHCRGRNLIGRRGTVDVPGQRRANITMCGAISDDGLLLHKPLIRPYNTDG